MEINKPLIRILQILCILTAIFWIILAILTISRGTNFFIPTIMFVSATLELLITLGFQKINKKLLWIFLIYTIFNLILTVTDQMGLWDFIFLGIYLSKVVITIIELRKIKLIN
jgi:hypothetical protein